MCSNKKMTYIEEALAGPIIIVVRCHLIQRSSSSSPFLSSWSSWHTLRRHLQVSSWPQIVQSTSSDFRQTWNFLPIIFHNWLFQPKNHIFLLILVHHKIDLFITNHGQDDDTWSKHLVVKGIPQSLQRVSAVKAVLYFAAHSVPEWEECFNISPYSRA